jgi:hypothetical protein
MISPVHLHRIWNVAMVAIVLMAAILVAYAYWGMPFYLGTGGQSVFNSIFHRGPQELQIEDFVPSDIETLTPDQAVAANIASPLEKEPPAQSVSSRMVDE